MVIGEPDAEHPPGAMPWLHRYIGNPLLSGFLNLLFRTGVDDAHCGMRALRRDRLPQLDLRTTGMEFASEMVIRAAKENLVLSQFPIEYHPRGGESKLSSCPRRLAASALPARPLPHPPVHLPRRADGGPRGLIELIIVVQLDLFGREWGIHALIAGCCWPSSGHQVMALGVCAHAYATYFMGEKDRWFDRMRARYKLEHGLASAACSRSSGILGGIIILIDWAHHGFGALAYEYLSVLAATLIIIGIQVFFTSFLISILGLRRQDQTPTLD